RAEIEAVIRVARPGRDGTLLGDRGKCHGGRSVVRHVEKARHAARDRSPGLARDRALRGPAGLAEMHLIVDQTGQNVAAAELDHLRVGRHRPADPADSVAFDQKIRFDDAALVHDPAVDEHSTHLRSLSGTSSRCETRVNGETDAMNRCRSGSENGDSMPFDAAIAPAERALLRLATPFAAMQNWAPPSA